MQRPMCLLISLKVIFSASEENETVNGDVHPEITPIPGRRQALFGMHFVRVPIGFNLTYYHYLEAAEFSSGRDWVNFTMEYRF